MYKGKFSYYFDNIINFFIFFLPISIVLGNAALNINIFFLISFFLYKNFINFINKEKFFLYFLFIFIITNVLFSEDYIISIRGSVGVIKSVLIFFSLIYFFKTKKKFNIFNKSFSLVFAFVVIDSFIQYFFGQDLFGYTTSSNHGNRLSGPFGGNEYIVGGYIVKSLFFFINNIKFNKTYIKYLIILISITLVILAYQRMPILLIFPAFFLYLFFDLKVNFRNKLVITFVLLLIPIILISIKPNLKKHYIDRTFEQIGIIKTAKEQKLVHNNFFDTQWGAHYLTAIEIFKQNPLFGSGLKTFRVICSDSDFERIKSVEFEARCSTHPHNIYLEILSETGLIGLIFFSYIIYFLIFRNNNINYNFIIKNNYLAPLLFIYLWPLQSTGSFFSTWNGFFFILFFVLLEKAKNTKLK